MEVRQERGEGGQTVSRTERRFRVAVSARVVPGAICLFKSSRWSIAATVLAIIRWLLKSIAQM
jgi:hypothetical protein